MSNELNRYALNLADNGRILSATYEQYAAEDAVLVDALPTGDTEAEQDISNWLYVNGEYVFAPMQPTITPAQQREEAYNTAKIIPWDGGYITVTEAAQLWQYYAAEGNHKAEELTALIANAKAEIREQFPEVEA